MKLVVVSPPDDRQDEREICRALFHAGLKRYHLRKPWTQAVTSAWLLSLPRDWRLRIILHTHHGLAQPLGAGGVHFRDDKDAPESPPIIGRFTSRSCHDVKTVQAALGRYPAILVGPVFTSHSKPGYGPMPEPERAQLSTMLVARTPVQRTTEVIAIGGISTPVLGECSALGFDGAAVLGALWDAPDPVAAFVDLSAAAAEHTTPSTEGKRKSSP